MSILAPCYGGHDRLALTSRLPRRRSERFEGEAVEDNIVLPVLGLDDEFRARTDVDLADWIPATSVDLLPPGERHVPAAVRNGHVRNRHAVLVFPVVGDAAVEPIAP